ncbi:glycosyltransferase family 4 protein [Flavobacterium cellulosilyticum]|uniref:Glycosyltransferase n=1 Tax=Flavobacterium cellulosilyticum TaxID=2541731 RepID=A0A4R5C8V1_9FLAO|nr:glycosyltransferase family 4 protein [Flavobacterium cellulosilyticum]TDD95066.1 glycosyltransferase [Flavobacterium cellulosilyticum]
MKVLWITNDVIESFYPFVEGKPTKGGSWVESLYFALNKYSSIELGILTPVLDGNIQKIIQNNIIYYTIPINKKSKKNYLSKELSEHYLAQIYDFEPDIIHIHGTELNFGLIAKLVPLLPVVCSIQGIISCYMPYLKSSVANIDINRFKSLKNWLFYGGVNGFYTNWNKYSIIEKEIYKNNKYFIGRTNWDRAQLKALNPNAHYFHGEELLRNAFYKTQWDLLTCKRETIFFSSAAYSVKGLHVLLKAVNLLKTKYPNILVNVPLSQIKNKLTLRERFFGEDYTIYLGYLIRKFNLEKNINFFKRLNAQAMAEQYKSNHIFVLASFIENSPNSLGESMLVGCPTITSFVGGIGSIVKDEESTLMFPSGDSNFLAYQIDRMFSNDELAQKLSVNAKKIAEKRHHIKGASSQYQNIYENIVYNNRI